MICCYHSDYDLEKMSNVNDVFLNELLQEVRKKMPDVYLEEYEFSVRRFLRKPKKFTMYSVMINNGGAQSQILNFCTEKNHSFGECVSMAQVTNYFYGLLNGYKRGQQNN